MSKKNSKPQVAKRTRRAVCHVDPVDHANHGEFIDRQVQDGVNGIRSYVAVLMAVANASSFHNAERLEISDEIELGSAESWLDAGLELIWEQIDRQCKSLEDMTARDLKGLRDVAQGGVR